VGGRKIGLESVRDQEKRREQENHNVGRGPTGSERFNVREVNRRKRGYGSVGGAFLISTGTGRWRLTLKLGRFPSETNTLLPFYRRLLTCKSGLNARKEVCFSIQSNRHIHLVQTVV
jgi:hypothetical protein